MRIDNFASWLAESISPLVVVLCACATAFFTAAKADDTEVFFGQNTAQANVLFVVDVSGSMGWSDGGSITRLNRVKAAMTELLTTTNHVNVGLLSFTSYGNYLHQEIRPITENRAEMLASVASLSAGGGTPTVGALLDGARYFRGEAVPDMGVSYNSPMQSACQSNHIVLLTDGSPTYDAIGPTKAKIAPRQCQTLSPLAGTCGAELASWLLETDHAQQVADVNGITTHTIGFNFSSSWLPTVSAAGNGQHFTTDSTAGLISAFDNIIDVASNSSNSFAAPAITLDQTTRLSHRDDMYLALFEPSNSQRWSGNLKRYRFDGSVRGKNGEVAIDLSAGKIKDSAHSFWSNNPDGAAVKKGGAANKLNVDQRSVYTYTGSGTNDLTAFVNRVHENNDKLTAAMLNVPPNERDNLVKWGRGVDVDDEYEGSTRLHLGDPLHSRPTIVTYGGTSDEPDSLIFVGTNEGFLHAINSSDGAEKYAFIPPELLPNLDVNYQNARTINRVYGLDGDLTLWVNDENNDGSITDTEHAYLYMGMRRGGRSYSALDVTDKDKPRFLWSINGGDDGFEKLGQSWSKATMGKISVKGVKTDVLIFGGGYDPMQDNANFRSPDTVGNDLFIINAHTGALLWNTSYDATSFEAMEYSIPSDPRVIDINGDGLVDQIYIGDMGGQVWRFDIDNNTLSDEPIVTGGVIAEFSSDSPNGNRRFFYPPDVALVYDGKKQFLTVSIGSGNRARPKETLVEDRFYMVRQHSLFKAPDGYGMVDSDNSDDSETKYRAVKEADLYDATPNLIGSEIVNISNDAIQSLSAKEGWLVSMTASGEKVLAPSVTVNNTVVFTSYVPEILAPDNCEPAVGSGRRYMVSVLDATPIEGNSKEDRYDELASSGIPPEPTPHIDADSNLRIVVGYEEIDVPVPPMVKRVFWTEQPDY